MRHYVALMKYCSILVPKRGHIMIIYCHEYLNKYSANIYESDHMQCSYVVINNRVNKKHKATRPNIDNFYTFFKQPCTLQVFPGDVEHEKPITIQGILTCSSIFFISIWNFFCFVLVILPVINWFMLRSYSYSPGLLQRHWSNRFVCLPNASEITQADRDIIEQYRKASRHDEAWNIYRFIYMCWIYFLIISGEYFNYTQISAAIGCQIIIHIFSVLNTSVPAYVLDCLFQHG